MPLMPGQLREYMIQCGIDRMSAEALLDNPPLAKRWHEVASLDAPASALKKIGDWFANDILSQLAGSEIDLEGSMDSTPSLLNARQLITLAKMTEDNLISSSAAKALLAAHWTDLYDVEAIAKEMDLLQVSDEGELEMIVAQVMSENQKAAEDVRAGETKAIGFLTGQVMKTTAGKANPSVVQAIIKKLLGLS